MFLTRVEFSQVELLKIETLSGVNCANSLIEARPKTLKRLLQYYAHFFSDFETVLPWISSDRYYLQATTQ
ncbi:Hypothetical predicted protein, partial [Paramuricea clavata]